MQRQQLLVKIKNLTQNEKNSYHPIATFVFQNYQNSSMMKKINISSLAQKTNSSLATITRFCKYLGLSGFKEFVAILNEEKNDLIRNQFIAENLSLKNKINEIISETIYLIDEQQLNNLIFDILNPEKQIFLLGYGESGLFLEMFASRLLRLGIKVVFLSQIEDMGVAANLANEKTTILALSLSGQTKVVLDFVNLCKKGKAKIYSITKYEDNRLKKISDVNFSISYEVDSFLITKTPRYAIIFILDLIFEKIIAFNPEKYLFILRKTS